MQKLYRNKNLYLYIMSFLLPFILICLIFAVLHVYPFGNSLFLVHDLSGQYISFLTYLRDMADNKNDFFYSFSQVFGLDVVGVICYYLLSPFNILVFLIKNTETGGYTDNHAENCGERTDIFHIFKCKI